jgi:hypothetical protein
MDQHRRKHGRHIPPAVKNLFLHTLSSLWIAETPPLRFLPFKGKGRGGSPDRSSLSYQRGLVKVHFGGSLPRVSVGIFNGNPVFRAPFGERIPADLFVDISVDTPPPFPYSPRTSRGIPIKTDLRKGGNHGRD